LTSKNSFKFGGQSGGKCRYEGSTSELNPIKHIVIFLEVIEAKMEKMSNWRSYNSVMIYVIMLRIFKHG